MNSKTIRDALCDLFSLQFEYLDSAEGEPDSGVPEHRFPEYLMVAISTIPDDEQRTALEAIKAYADIRAVLALSRAVKLLCKPKVAHGGES